ncbi:MAG TPA: hypothetical protein DDW18_03120 [Firmicutes bacterium]|nr:hypothetical protein [Bacillota bacterium]HBM99663.1 hypothetical protein [Bacillota bacterium]
MGWLFFGFAFWNKTNSHYARGINVFGKGFGDYRQDIVAQILWRMRILKFFWRPLECLKCRQSGRMASFLMA